MKNSDYIKKKRYLFKQNPEGYVKFRGCDRKKKLSKMEADDIVDIILEREQRLVYYYQCKYCTKYHITKSEPR